MQQIDSLEQVENLLHELMDREDPLVSKLPRQAGRKEHRYAQRLSGEPEIEEQELKAPAAILQVRAENQRLEELESEVDQLKREITELKREFESFRRQFE